MLVILKWLLIAAFPVAVFVAGAMIMNKIVGREDLGRQIELSKELKGKKPLNQRWAGYDRSAVEEWWQGLKGLKSKSGRDFLEIERRFLEIDLIFPFVYLGALAVSLVLAWTLLDRQFGAAWLIAPLAIGALADWTENLAQLGLFRRFPGALDGALVQTASIATVVKLYAVSGAFLFVFALAVVGIWRHFTQSA